MTKPMRVDLVDQSHHNATPNLALAKSKGVKGYWHKASEGATFRDPEYMERRRRALAAGMPFGAYHFASPDSESGADAVAEARFFMRAAGCVPGDLLPMLDVEAISKRFSRAELTNWVATFNREVKRLIGVVPILYTNYDLDPGFGLESNGGSILWMARYNDKNTPPPRPATPWKQIDIWQFSNGELGVPDHWPGFPGNTDLNTIMSDITLRDLRIPRPVTHPQLEETRDIRVITQNVKALPLMPQDDVVEDITLTAKQAHIVGWQEIGPDRYKEAVRDLDPNIWTTWWAEVGDERWMDAPISFRKNRFKFIDGGHWMLNPARPEVSVRREFVWVILQDLQTGLRFWVDNKHYIAGAWNDTPKPHKAQRPGWWRESAALEVAWTEEFMKDHPRLNGIKLGDYNANAKVMEREFPDRIAERALNYQVGPKAIDQIILLNNYAGTKRWQVDDQDGELLLGRNSDHQGRRSTQSLKEVRAVKH